MIEESDWVCRSWEVSTSFKSLVYTNYYLVVNAVVERKPVKLLEKGCDVFMLLWFSDHSGCRILCSSELVQGLLGDAGKQALLKLLRSRRHGWRFSLAEKWERGEFASLVQINLSSFTHVNLCICRQVRIHESTNITNSGWSCYPVVPY